MHGTAGIDREDRNFFAEAAEMHTEGFDKGALAGARDAGEAEAEGAAAVREERLHEGVRGVGVTRGAALDEGNRLREARAVIGADPLDEGLDVKLAWRWHGRGAVYRSARRMSLCSRKA